MRFWNTEVAIWSLYDIRIAGVMVGNLALETISTVIKEAP